MKLFLYIPNFEPLLMAEIVRNFKGRIATDDAKDEIQISIRQFVRNKTKNNDYQFDEDQFQLQFEIPVNGGNLGVKPLNLYSLLVVYGVFVDPSELEGKEYIDIINTRYSVDKDGNPKIEATP